MRRALEPLVVAAGLLVAAATAWVLGIPSGDTARLLAVAFGAALAVGIVGRLLVTRLRRASIATQVAAVALVSVTASAVGVAAAAEAMFVSPHDLAALAVVLVAAGTAGVLAAVSLGRRVGTATRTLGAAARRIGDGDGHVPLTGGDGSRELARLARELDETHRRLDEARARERLLEQSRRELVAWVSHDLRTPLAGIRAMVEALDDGVVDDPQTVARYYRTIQSEADRVSGLVDDLFELSRIQADALELTLVPVSLGDLVSDALASLRAVADAKGIVLQGSVEHPDPVVDVSPPEMSRVLCNLLENAIRHTPPSGAVQVEVCSDATHAYLAVADSCGGIPEDDLDRVFDLAFRGDAARSPASNVRGGLGLAIARGLVEAHGGVIRLVSDAAGCRFVVVLVRSASRQRSNAPMSRTARTEPRTVPVTFDRPARAE